MSKRFFIQELLKRIVTSRALVQWQSEVDVFEDFMQCVKPAEPHVIR